MTQPSFSTRLRATAVNTAGFTLVEMLIVMMIVVTLMSMGIGGWMNTAKRSQSLATQQLIYSMVQQARNRSLSSGQAVVLQLRKDDGTIVGLHKNYLFHVKNAWSAIQATARDADKTAQDLPLFIDEQGGFVLHCQVNAPPAGNAAHNVIPLIHITTEGHSDGARVDENSPAPQIAGLELWNVPQFVHDDEADDAVPVAQTWALVGWVGTRPKYPPGEIPSDPSPDRNNIATWNSFIKASNFVREWSFADDDANSSNQATTLDETRYGLHPYTGDRWMDVELVYDNNNLYLMRNGQRSDFLKLPSQFRPLEVGATVGGEIDIYIGSHQIGPDSNNLKLSDADINNVSVIQIGSGDAEQLPSGIMPQYNYKIVCLDGVITCYAETDPNDSSIQTEVDTIQFVDGADPQLATASFDISLSPDGTLSSSTLYPAAGDTQTDSETPTDPKSNPDVP